MAKQVVDEDRGALLAEALGVLERGGLVCVPTETVYGIGCRSDRPEAVERLRAFKGARGDKPFTLHIGEAAEAFARGRSTPAAHRLADAFWPGPLTLVLDRKDGRGSLAFRVVDEDFTRELCLQSPAPLCLSSVNRSGGEPALDAATAEAVAGDAVALVVDGGPCRLGAPSTVVAAPADGSIEVLRAGALPENQVLARAATLVLFLCSGNTCRSPMAELLARRLYAERLGCAPEELLDRGVLVTSAGCATMPGQPASANAVAAMAELGLDLSEHRTRALEPALLARASRVWCMSHHHVDIARELRERVPLPGQIDGLPPALLGGDEEIPDPFGGPLEVYRECRDRIAALLPATFPL
ncbi:MAG: Sua5/YciO/YrdC/YwlC family protein [Planctomycetota bacterium]